MSEIRLFKDNEDAKGVYYEAFLQDIKHPHSRRDMLGVSQRHQIEVEVLNGFLARFVSQSKQFTKILDGRYVMAHFSISDKAEDMPKGFWELLEKKASMVGRRWELEAEEVAKEKEDE